MLNIFMEKHFPSHEQRFYGYMCYNYTLLNTVLIEISYNKLICSKQFEQFETIVPNFQTIPESLFQFTSGASLQF